MTKTKGSLWGLLFFTAAVLVISYLANVIYLYMSQGALVFPGASHRPENLQKIAENPSIGPLAYEVPQAVLSGWHTNAVEKAPMVLYYGGNAEDISFRTLQLAALTPFHTVLVNYRGYGNSTGSPSEQLLYADALYVFDDLVRRYQPQKVFLIGRSLGSGVATYVATHRRVEGVVLITPFDSVTEIGKVLYPWAPVGWLAKHAFDSYGRAEKMTVPTMVLLAERDVVVTHNHSERLIEKLPKVESVTTLAGVNHDDIVTSPAFLPLVEIFLLAH